MSPPHPHAGMLELVGWVRKTRVLCANDAGQLGQYVPDTHLRDLMAEIVGTDSETLTRLVSYLCLQVIAQAEQYSLATGRVLPWPAEDDPR